MKLFKCQNASIGLCFIASICNLIGCELPTKRKSMELIHLNSTGELIVGRFVQSDTGLLKEQGHFRSHVFSHVFANKQSPLSFWGHAPSNFVQWQDDMLKIGLDHQLHYNISTENTQTLQWNSHHDDWNLRLLGEYSFGQSAVLQHQDWKSQVKAWNIQSVGWIQSGESSLPLEGTAILIEHQGESIDYSGHILAWIIHPTQHFLIEEWEHPKEISAFTQSMHRASNLDIIASLSSMQPQFQWGETLIEIKDLQQIGSELPYEHLSQLELWLLNPWMPPRHIEWFVGHALFHTDPISIGSVILRKQVSDLAGPSNNDTTKE